VNVLVLCDDYWHPAMIPMRGLEPLRESGFAFDFIGHTSEWPPASWMSTRWCF